MNRLMGFICLTLALAPACRAGEHPEHPMGAETSQAAPAAAAAPSGQAAGSKAWVSQMRKDYNDKVVAVSKEKTPYVIHDDKLNKDWQLKLVKVHKDKIVSLDPEGKHVFACSDFKSVKKGDKGKVDIDFYATRNPDGSLTIDKTLIHKVDGKERYKYNAKNEMVPAD